MLKGNVNNISLQSLHIVHALPFTAELLFGSQNALTFLMQDIGLGPYTIFLSESKEKNPQNKDLRSLHCVDECQL